MGRLDASRVVSGALLAAVALAPVVFLPASADIFGLPKLAAIAVLVAVAAVAHAAGARGGPASPGAGAPPIVLPVGVFLAAFALATLTSRSRLTSLVGGAERYGGLVPVVLYGLAAVLVGSVARRDPKLLRRLPVAVVSGSTVLACYLIAQAAGVDVVDWTDEVGGTVRYHAGSMGNSNFAGGQLGIAVTLAVHLASVASAWRRSIALVAVLLCGAGLWITSSRGGLVAALAGLAVLAVWNHRRIAPTPRARVVAGVALAAVLTAGIVVAPRLTAVSAVGRNPLLRTESAGARLRTWTAGIEMALDRPVTGHGPDTFGLLYPQYRTVEDARTLGLRITDKPHNVLIEHLASGGVVLAGAYAFVVVWAARRLRRSRSESGTLDPAVVPAFAAAFAAYLAQAAVSIDVPPLGFLGWVLLGAAVAAADRPHAQGRARRGASAFFARAVGATAVAIAAATLVAVVADVTAARARARHGEAALATFDDAIERNPLQVAYRSEAAFAAEGLGAEAPDVGQRRRWLEDALRRYEDAADRAPASLVPAVGRARTLTLLARGVDPSAFPAANDAWRDALELDPLDWELFSAYGLMLNSWANAAQGDPSFRREAETQLERAVEINPASFHGWANLTRVRLGLRDAAGAAESLARAEALEPDHSDLVELRSQLAAEG